MTAGSGRPMHSIDTVTADELEWRVAGIELASRGVLRADEWYAAVVDRPELSVAYQRHS